MVTLEVLMWGAGEIVFLQKNIYPQRKNGAVEEVGIAEAAWS